MDVADLFANAPDRLSAKDHLGIHIERDVKKKIPSDLPEIFQEGEIVLDMLEDIETEDEIEIALAIGRYSLVAKFQARGAALGRGCIGLRHGLEADGGFRAKPKATPWRMAPPPQPTSARRAAGMEWRLQKSTALLVFHSAVLSPKSGLRAA